jgi:hypothetical protein
MFKLCTTIGLFIVVLSAMGCNQQTRPYRYRSEFRVAPVLNVNNPQWVRGPVPSAYLLGRSPNEGNYNYYNSGTWEDTRYPRYNDQYRGAEGRYYAWDPDYYDESHSAERITVGRRELELARRMEVEDDNRRIILQRHEDERAKAREKDIDAVTRIVEIQTRRAVRPGRTYTVE